MSDRLKADLTRIRQVSARLSWVEREFSDATEFARDYGGFLGSAELAGALDSFASGWSKHRAALLSELTHVARLSELAADSYQGADDKLADALRKAEGGS
jgi:hypothetical protein